MRVKCNDVKVNIHSLIFFYSLMLRVKPLYIELVYHIKWGPPATPLPTAMDGPPVAELPCGPIC